MPEVDGLVRGLKAGNTTRTMAPKTVNVLEPPVEASIGQYHDYLTYDPDGLTNGGVPKFDPPELEHDDGFKKSVFGEFADLVHKEQVFGPPEPKSDKTKTDPCTLGWEEDQQWAAKSKPVSRDPHVYLTDRVERLEDQMDSLLDRIATHNQRAQHKI